jgi:FkbM family methyltransferase
VKNSRTFTILASVAVLALVSGAAWFPPVRLFALASVGRSPVCPLRHAVRATDNLQETMRIANGILARNRLVREEAGLELWDTPKGPFWIPRGNRYVLPFNLAEMERRVYASPLHFIQPGDIVLDCGASDGDFTREALRAGAARVVSVEISPAAQECIRRNLSAEIAAGRVILYPKGVWDRDDTLTLNVDDTNFAANSVVLHPDKSHPSVQVPLTTIDRIAAELGLPRVDFIKMDVEGAEVKALAGAAGVLARFKPRLAIATEHKPDDQFTIPAAVRQARADYQMECGQCLEKNGHIRPDVLFFW